MHTGLTEEEIEKELEIRKKILDWMRLQNISDLDLIGFIMKMYYSDASKIKKFIKNNLNYSINDKISIGNYSFCLIIAGAIILFIANY